MKERKSGDMLRIPPIRVGDGDIEGIPFNAIIPDVRKKSIDQSAELIVERLRLVLPSQSTEKDVSSAHHNWPLEAVQFKHGLADRAVHEWPAVLQTSHKRGFQTHLMLEGPSGFSKSALLRAAARYAKILAVPTVYLDFKDTLFLIEINVLRELQLGLGKALPAFAAQKEPTGWTFRQALRAFQEPVLIFLDTYEKAAETKELVGWIETQLLVEVEECEQLRFLIGGKKVPGTTQSRWRGCAEKVELDRIDDQRVWKEWVHELNPNVEEKHVEAFVIACQGVPADISTYLTALAQKLDRPA